MWKILAALLLLVPLAAFACWQMSQNPSLVKNTKISGVITYELKPMRAAQLRLEDSAGRVIADTKTDGKGMFEFRAIKPGRYILRMLKPSYERIDIDLLPPGSLLPPTVLRINYYYDFCQEVQVVPGI